MQDQVQFNALIHATTSMLTITDTTVNSFRL